MQDSLDIQSKAPFLRRIVAFCAFVLPSIFLSLSLFASWQPLGPYGGHALKILLDPANPRNLLVATKNGQLFHSRDGGAHWEPLPFSLPEGSVLQAIIFNPEDSKQIYVGAAEGSGARSADSKGGVFQSNDGGLTWLQLETTRNWSVLSLAVHPRKTSVLVAGAMDGVYRSEDRGQTWHRVSPEGHPELKGVVSLALDPLDPEVIYAGTPHLPWRTLDKGNNWKSIHEGMIDDSDVFSLAVDRIDSLRVFASACSGIYRSETRGGQWSKVQGIPGSNRRTHVILQDPVDKSILYAGTTQGLWKSEDAGVTWRKPNAYPYMVNSIAIDPTDHNRVFLATDRSGILKSLDGGITYQSVNQGFTNRNITRFLVGETFYLSSVYDGEFGGIFTSQDQGQTWSLKASQLSLQGRNVLALTVSPVNPNLLFAGTYEGLLRSRDKGDTWEQVRFFPPSPAVQEMTPRAKVARQTQSRTPGPTKPLAVRIYDVRFSPFPPHGLYLATNCGLFQSFDDGTSWKSLTVDEGNAVYRIAFHPSGQPWMLTQSSRGLWFSRDQGEYWKNMELPKQGMEVFNFAFSPDQALRIFAVTSHGLCRSFDGSQFVNVQGDGLPMIPYHHLCFSRLNPGKIVVISNRENQVYQSTDGGESWDRVDNRGLTGFPLQSITAGIRGDTELYVLSENRGLFSFQRDLPFCPGRIEISTGCSN